MRNIKTIVTLISLVLFLSYSFCLGALPEPISEWKFNGSGINAVS